MKKYYSICFQVSGQHNPPLNTMQNSSDYCHKVILSMIPEFDAAIASQRDPYSDYNWTKKDALCNRKQSVSFVIIKFTHDLDYDRSKYTLQIF